MFAGIWRTLHPQGEIGALWCSLMHDSAMWPIHGHYECGVCGRRYPVPWAADDSAGAVQARRGPLPSLPSAILPVLLLMAVAAAPGRAAESIAPVSAPRAEAVLQRFIFSQGETDGWPLETIEIQASLPKLNQTGRLRAIRRLFPVGRPDYKVLEIAGDSTVKHQIIARYLSADEKATGLPSSSVALIPANYRFHYAGIVQLGDRLAYAFRVIPRKKREGLINGVLWLDSETAIAIRESGYLAKSPSVFLKRVNVTRENELHNGTVEARITRLSIETRLIGRAQLTIVERPSSDELSARGATADGQ